MQIRILLLLVAAVRAIPLATSGPASDADEAVAYPAQADQSWVDATRRSVDADEAVAYPAQIDQSWVDSDT